MKLWIKDEGRILEVEGNEKGFYFAGFFWIKKMKNAINPLAHCAGSANGTFFIHPSRTYCGGDVCFFLWKYFIGLF